MKRSQINKDAYGQELWNYFSGKDTSEIVERDDGYIDISPGPELYFAEYKHWPSEEKLGMRFVKGRMLDVGCGAGRHSIYFKSKGLNVTGIDSSPLAINICKLRGMKKAKVMDIKEIGKFKPNSFEMSEIEDFRRSSKMRSIFEMLKNTLPHFSAGCF